MMGSLRRRLVIATACGATLVLIGTGSAVYFAAAHSLRAEFDAGLLAKARALSAMVEEEEGKIEFENELVTLTELRPGPDAEYLQLRSMQGETLYRSASLGDRKLELENPADISPRCTMVTLPDGRPGRQIAFVFQTHVNADEATPAQRTVAPQVEILLARSIVSLNHQTHRLAWVLICCGAGALLAMLIILDQSVRRGLKPLSALTAQIARVNPDDLSTHVSVPGAVSELSPIIDTLNELLGRLKLAFEREKGLTADIAHELRTPLSGLRSMIEVALLRERAPAEYQEALRGSGSIVQQMQSLTENLLALARAETGEVVPGQDEIHWDELVRSAWAPFEARAAQRPVTVECELDEVRTIGSRAGCETILRNLFDNAMTYVDEKGRVRISCGADSDQVVLAVRNTGCTLVAEQMSHVFERFWRADPVRTPGHLHYGLGLALVRRLVIGQGGSVRATCQDGWFSIEVLLPLAR